MPLDTNTQASVKPALFLAARTGNADVYTPSMTSVQRGEVAKKLNGAADVLMDNVRWGAVRESEGAAEGTAFRIVYGILRRLAHAVETYTPPVAPPAPAPVYEWGQRVTVMRRGCPAEAIFVAGPDGDGDVKVVFSGAGLTTYVQAADVSPITPAAVPEPVAPPAPRRPRVGDLVRVLKGGVYPPGTIGTLTMVDFDNEARVEANGQTTDNWHLFRHFDVIRPVEWTPKVGDKVKVVGRSYLGFEAGDVVGAVDHVEASVSHAILLRFPGECGRKNYKPEQVYPASL